MLKVIDFSINSKENNIQLLDKVSFEVGENEIHCILGKNGSGKTTLAYSIMAFDRYVQTGGELIFDGQDISERKTFERARAGITIAFQEPARFEGLTVKDFLLISSPSYNKRGLGGVNDSKDANPSVSPLTLRGDDKELERVLNSVGLDGKKFLDRKLDEKLSGGERKRIELASVIMMKPKLMILDEPDASLDIIVYNELYDLMLRIRKEIGCSILLITHREEAGLIADKATLIESGKIIKTGRFREVMREYCGRMGVREKCMVQKIRNSKF